MIMYTNDDHYVPETTVVNEIFFLSDIVLTNRNRDNYRQILIENIKKCESVFTAISKIVKSDKIKSKNIEIRINKYESLRYQTLLANHYKYCLTIEKINIDKKIFTNLNKLLRLRTNIRRCYGFIDDRLSAQKTSYASKPVCATFDCSA